jgi:selenocysteine-specific elongation factor
VLATVYLMEGDAARAGDERLIQVRANEPLVAGCNDGFILRTASPPLTVGGGKIVEALGGKLKRTKPEVVAEAKELAGAVRSDRAFVEFAVKHAARLAADERELALRTRTLPARVKEILASLAAEGRIIPIESGRGTWVHRDAAAALDGRILEALGDFHRAKPESPGMPSADLQEAVAARHAVPLLDKAVFAARAAALKQQGKLVEKTVGGRPAAPLLALAGHQEQFTEEERRLVDAVEGLFRRRPFSPPDADELARELRAEAKKVERTLRILIEHGRLVRLAEGLFFHADAVERARQILTDFIRKEGELESVKFKYLLDTSRKYAIPLLDYFDQIGVTVRRGYTRYLKEKPGGAP